ncbi:MAG: hypothetical protein ACMG6E_08620, partial [Candidatus Roizmanbacteria bacterium]
PKTPKPHVYLNIYSDNDKITDNHILVMLFSTLMQVSSSSLNRFSSVSWRSFTSLDSSYMTFPCMSSIILNMVV